MNLKRSYHSNINQQMNQGAPSPLMSSEENYYVPQLTARRNKNEDFHNFNTNSNESQMMHEAYLSEVTNMISMLVTQNNQMMQRLSNQNQILLKHFENIKNIITFKQNQSLREQQSFSNHHNRSKAYKTPKTYKKKQQDLKKPKFTVKHTIKLQENDNVNDKIQGKLNISSVKGKVNYKQSNWAIEQQSILNFIHQYLKKNIRQTPQDPHAIIQKEQVHTLYQQWKNLKGLTKSNCLKDQQIKQILTNEIKAAFNCIANAKGYSGLKFILQNEVINKIQCEQNPQRQQNKSDSKYFSQQSF